MTSLTIAFYKANSIKTQRSEIIPHSTYSVHILLVNKTFQKKRNYFKKITNYKCIGKDQEHRGGATAVLIKHSIVCDQLALPNFNSFECCGISLSRGADKLHLVSLYKQPSSRMEETELLQLFSTNVPTTAAVTKTASTPAGAVVLQM